eukprot:351773-Chlamydomonas_euryale.AAC.32
MAGISLEAKIFNTTFNNNTAMIGTDLVGIGTYVLVSKDNMSAFDKVDLFSAPPPPNPPAPPPPRPPLPSSPPPSPPADLG